MAEMQLEAQMDARGGINSFVHPSLVPEDMAVNLLNADISEPGVIKKRKGIELAGDDFGTKKILALSGYRLLGTGRRMIAIDDTNVWYWSGSGSWTAKAHGKTITEAEIVICNSLAVILHDGANQQAWSMSSPTSITNYGTDQSGAGDMPITTTVGCWHKNRLLVAKNDEVYWSTTLDFTDGNWNHSTYLHKVDKGSGQLVKKLWEFDKDTMLWFMDGSIFAVNTASLVGNWDATKIPGQGTIAPRSVCQYGSEAFYLDRNGFWRVGGQYPLTRPLENGWMTRINWLYAHKAAAKVWKNRILLAVPIDGSTENNCVFVYHLMNDPNREGRGWTVWTSDKLEISDWATFDFNNELKLYGACSNTTGAVYEIETDDNYADDGTGYNFEYETRAFAYGAPIVDKAWETLEVTAKSEQENSVLLPTYVSVEENDYIQVYDESEGQFDIHRDLIDFTSFEYSNFDFGNDFLISGFFGLDRFNRGKFAQFKVTNTQADVPVEINRLVSSALPQPYRRTAY